MFHILQLIDEILRKNKENFNKKEMFELSVTC